MMPAFLLCLLPRPILTGCRREDRQTVGSGKQRVGRAYLSFIQIPNRVLWRTNRGELVQGAKTHVSADSLVPNRVIYVCDCIKKFLSGWAQELATALRSAR